MRVSVVRSREKNDNKKKKKKKKKKKRKKIQTMRLGLTTPMKRTSMLLLLLCALERVIFSS